MRRDVLGVEYQLWHLAHAARYDGDGILCQQRRLVAVDPCGWREREAGFDQPKDRSYATSGMVR